jgi:hypothetical protein
MSIVSASKVLVTLLLFPIHAGQEVRRARLFHRLVLSDPDETWKSEAEAPTFKYKSLRGN